MNRSWYALRSKPHKEFLLFEQVQAREIECFFPKIKVNPINKRSAKVRPYFPSYLFVHVDINKIGTNTFKWMPYAQGLITFADDPARIPEEIITKLKMTIESINNKGGLKVEKIHPGDRIQIISGPFEGYEGIFDTRISGSDRIKVLIQLLYDRQLSVEMQIGHIQPKLSPKPIH